MENAHEIVDGVQQQKGYKKTSGQHWGTERIEKGERGRVYNKMKL